MKLDNEQLEKLDVILEKLGLDFLDFKLEVKDHIATQTENLCEKQNISFEEALPKVLKEWEPSLILKTSIWISNKRSFSSIVLDGIKRRYMIYNSITLPLIFGLIFLQSYFVNEFQSKSLNNLFLTISTIVVITLSIFWFLISTKNYQTSYSYEFNRIYKIALMFLCFDIFFYYQVGTTPIILFKAMIVTYFPIAIYSFLKHKQFQNQMNSLQV